MKRYQPLLLQSIEFEWTSQDNALYSLFESYVKTIDYGNKLNEFGIPQVLKDQITFIKQLAIDTGFKLFDLFKLFLNKEVFKLFQLIGWSIHKLSELFHEGMKAYKSLTDAIAEFVHNNPTTKWTSEKLKELDKFLENHPHTKHIVGIAVAGLLLYIWFSATFTGHLEEDFDLTLIFLAFRGHATLHEIFGTPAGTKMLILFATSTLRNLTFPWPGSNLAKLTFGVLFTLGKHFKIYLNKGHDENQLEEFKIKKYKPLTKIEERRLPQYKAWYNPESNYFRQFSTNGLHQEISQEDLKLNEAEAIQKGYYRIFVGHECDIDSYKIPTEREFKAVQAIIEENSIKKFEGTRWNIETVKGFIFFPKLSFLFADSIKEGKHKIL